MRILFMGTPDIAAECLKALYAAGHDICAVYTRRDKPVGRKQVLTAPPVKEVALEHGTPVFQPRTLRDGGEDANIQALAPELIVVVAYGCILPASVLNIPKYGCVNLHVSLLPKYRGSAPVQWAVLNGDTETGVSIMQMDEGLDTGDVLVCEKMPVDPEETSGELFDRVTAVGARVLCETIPAIAAGTLKPQKQDHENATLAPMLDKAMAEFKLSESAAHIHNWVRGMNPWPGAWFVTAGGKKVKVMECRVAESHGEDAAACGAGGQKAHGRHLVCSGPPPENGGQPLMAANPRAAAVAALVRQEQDGFSNLILDAELRRRELDGRDKAFASAIFYTVLEHRGTIDFILEQFLPKGLAKLDAPVREILRAAVAQARYMQVPVSAAVNEAVKLTRSFKKSSASGLVNAVLRKACVYDLDKAVFKDEIEKLMVLGSASREVAEFLHRHYPEEALGILTHTADGGMTSLRANPLKASAAQLCELLMQKGAKSAEPGIVPGSVLARFEGSPAEQELFRQGYYHVEGQASQLAALCVEAKPGDTVLDLCAAPGGKTLLLAEEMQGTGRLISCDVTENRVQLIAKAVERMGFTACVETLCNDASRPNPKLPQADRILVDAPCSGLGILAKKPDIRYKSLPKARHDELLATQSAILDTAASLLKAGGRLVYSTCTIDPAENEEQVAAFLNRHPEFRVVTPEVPFPQGMTVGEHGALSVPTRTGMDGFFLCAMQKQ